MAYFYDRYLSAMFHGLVKLSLWVALLQFVLALPGVSQQPQTNPNDIRSVYLKAPEVWRNMKAGMEVKAASTIDSLVESWNLDYGSIIWGYLFSYRAAIFHKAQNYFLASHYFKLADAYARLYHDTTLHDFNLNNRMGFLVEAFGTVEMEDLASTSLLQALKSQNPTLLYSLHSNLAYRAFDNGDLRAAEQEFRKMNRLEKEVPIDTSNLIPAKRLFGMLRQKTGDQHGALMALKEALVLSLSHYGENHFQTGQSYFRLGDYFAAKQLGDSALHYYRAAGKILENPGQAAGADGGSHRHESVLIEYRINLGKLLQHQLSRPQEAFIEFSLAIGEINQLSHSITSEHSRFILAEKGRRSYDSGIECALSLYQTTGEVAWLNQAFDWSIQAKSLSLFQLLEKDQLYPVIGIPDSLVARLKTLWRNLDYRITEDWTPTESQSMDSAVSLIWEYQNTEQEIQHFYQEIRNARLKAPLRSSVFDASLNGSLFLGYHELDSLMVIFIRQAGRLDVVKVNMDTVLKGDLADYHRLLTVQPIGLYSSKELDRFGHLGLKLYQAFVEPALRHYKGESLLIHSDGRLLGIPFESLPTTNKRANSFRDIHYLMNEYTISYASTPMLYTNNAHKKFQEVIILTCSAQAGLNALAPEIQGIRSSVGKTDVRYFNEPGFNLHGAGNGQFRLHIASHAVINLPDPFHSGLSCSPIDPPVLSFSDILNNDFRQTPVFVNGCQSGTGPLNHGEGFLSMGLAFALAGSPSVIQHYWMASDVAAMQLSGTFYYEIQRLPDAEALVKSKQKYLANCPVGADHPFYWAGVVCFGGTEAHPTSTVWVWMSIVSVISAGSAYWALRKRIRR